VAKISFKASEFGLFLLLNGIAALVNFLSRIGFGLFMSYFWSIIAAYVLGMITAYLLCRFFLFQSTQNSTKQEIIYFIFVNLVGVAQTVIVSIVLNKYVLNHFIANSFICMETAHLVGICFPAISSYFGHKYITFR
jgi:putative flippase GtrA